MGYIIKNKRYKIKTTTNTMLRAPRSPLSAALKIQAKLQVLLQQCMVRSSSTTTRVSHQHQRENGQRGSQAARQQKCRTTT